MPKIQILVFCKILYMQHTSWSYLIGWICKYKMDPTTIVKDTQQTWFWPEIDGQMGWCKTSIPRSPFNFVEAGGIITSKIALSTDSFCVDLPGISGIGPWMLLLVTYTPGLILWLEHDMHNITVKSQRDEIVNNKTISYTYIKKNIIFWFNWDRQH